MYLLLIAVLATLLKYFEIWPAADLSWWHIIGLFVATAVWWQVSDAIGYSRYKNLKSEEKTRERRLKRNRDQLTQRGGKR